MSEPSKRRWRLEGAWASAAFAGRTTLAAIAAMAAASLLGLSHLHWAAMTVWLVAQPTRGLLLEKSFLRVAGTLSGAAAAFGLHSVFPDRTLALVTGLTIWTGLCAGLGVFVRPFRAYGYLLAGYTAVLLALPALKEPAERLFADRVLCTLIGVLSSATMTALFTPRGRREGLDAQLRELARDVFAFASESQVGPISTDLLTRQRLLVADIGRVGALADQVISGFFTGLRGRRQVGEVLRVLQLLVVESRIAGERLPATERGRPSFATSPEPEPFMASASGDELLASIQRTAAAWRARAGAGGAPDARHGSRAVRASWSEAALVTAKTMVGMALVTAIWFGTGWRYGSVMLMSASVFLTLFSSNASARALVRQILLGSAGGALAAVLYVAILPASATPREAVVHAIPVLAVGAWAMTRPLTAKAAIDFNMVFLMAAQPAYAARGDVATTSSFGLAVVLGVLAATIFFHAAHESRRERIARLTREVVRELRRLAASGGPDVAGSRSAAMTDRVVRMAMASRVDDLIAPAVDAAVDLLGLGRAIERLVALRTADAPVVGGGDPVAAALTRIEGGLHRPLECAAGLERAADLLGGAGASPPQAPSRSAEAALSLRDAARVLRRQAPLLDIPPPPI